MKTIDVEQFKSLIKGSTYAQIRHEHADHKVKMVLLDFSKDDYPTGLLFLDFNGYGIVFVKEDNKEVTFDGEYWLLKSKYEGLFKVILYKPVTI